MWQWKEKYGGRISEQLRRLGRLGRLGARALHHGRGLSRAVSEAFVRLHEEGLIYRGKRLINWDPVLLTALSDLEVERSKRKGTLWHIAIR